MAGFHAHAGDQISRKLTVREDHLARGIKYFVTERGSLLESTSSLDSDRSGRDAKGDDEDEDNTMDFSDYLEESNSQPSKSKSGS